MKKLNLLITGFLILTILLNVKAQSPTLKGEYEAYMVQTGTNAPVPTLVVTSTLPCALSWHYNDFGFAGSPYVECDSTFTVDKTMIECTAAYADQCGHNSSVFINPIIDYMPNKIYFITDAGGAAFNCQRFWVHIRVYY